MFRRALLLPSANIITRVKHCLYDIILTSRAGWTPCLWYLPQSIVLGVPVLSAHCELVPVLSFHMQYLQQQL